MPSVKSPYLTDGSPVMTSIDSILSAGIVLRSIHAPILDMPSAGSRHWIGRLVILGLQRVGRNMSNCKRPAERRFEKVHDIQLTKVFRAVQCQFHLAAIAPQAADRHLRHIFVGDHRRSLRAVAQQFRLGVWIVEPKSGT